MLIHGVPAQLPAISVESKIAHTCGPHLHKPSYYTRVRGERVAKGILGTHCRPASMRAPRESSCWKDTRPLWNLFSLIGPDWSETADRRCHATGRCVGGCELVSGVLVIWARRWWSGRPVVWGTVGGIFVAWDVRMAPQWQVRTRDAWRCGAANGRRTRWYPGGFSGAGSDHDRMVPVNRRLRLAPKAGFT